jgi:hypothetical protein
MTHTLLFHWWDRTCNTNMSIASCIRPTACLAITPVLNTALQLSGTEEALKRKHIMEGVDLFRFDAGALYAIPIIVFGFNCHASE